MPQLVVVTGENILQFHSHCQSHLNYKKRTFRMLLVCEHFVVSLRYYSLRSRYGFTFIKVQNLNRKQTEILN